MLTTGAIGSILYSAWKNSYIAASYTDLVEDAFDPLRLEGLFDSPTSLIDVLVGKNSEELMDNDYNNHNYNIN